MGAGFCAGTMTGFAFVQNGYGNFFGTAKNGFFKSQLDADIDISAASGTISSSGTAAAKTEHTAENVPQVAHIKAFKAAAVETAAAHAALFKGCVTKLVILRTFFGVAQHFIGFVDFFEFFFCFFIARVLVRMVFDCHLTVSFFQLRFRCTLLYPQDLVIISFISQLSHHLVLLKKL